MSVAWEVKLCPECVCDAKWCATAAARGTVQNERYILASLTCGECAVEHPSQCAMPESAFDVLDYKRENRPACMKIAPKVKP